VRDFNRYVNLLGTFSSHMQCKSWELISLLIFQRSKFNPQAVSFVKFGVVKYNPRTGKFLLVPTHHAMRRHSKVDANLIFELYEEVSLVSFAAITRCVASQRVFIIVDFVIDSVRKLLDTPSCTRFGRRSGQLLTPAALLPLSPGGKCKWYLLDRGLSISTSDLDVCSDGSFVHWWKPIRFAITSCISLNVVRYGVILRSTCSSVFSD
jgi:hypothetical protein